MRERIAARLPAPLRSRLPGARRYELATRYLDGLRGIEIGASAHNPFPVEALNVDRYAATDTIYKKEELRLAGRIAPVDIVAPGDSLPLPDKSTDFVLASHVIEHFPDPVAALLEWERVATRYLFLVVPHRDRTFDAGRPITGADELLERHESGFTSEEDRHWSVWDCASFVELCDRIGLDVVATEDPDLKVGNGFAVVVAVDPQEPLGAVPAS